MSRRAEICIAALRHFFASWCINPNARGGRELPPKQVQYLLGHSTISMTFDIYGHLFPSESNRDEFDRSGAAVVGVTFGATVQKSK
jgi:integrase